MTQLYVIHTRKLEWQGEIINAVNCIAPNPPHEEYAVNDALERVGPRFFVGVSGSLRDKTKYKVDLFEQR